MSGCTWVKGPFFRFSFSHDTVNLMHCCTCTFKLVWICLVALLSGSLVRIFDPGPFRWMIGSSTIGTFRMFGCSEAGFQLWLHVNVTWLDHHFGFNLIKGKLFWFRTHSTRSNDSLLGRWVDGPHHCKCNPDIRHCSSNRPVLSNQYYKTVSVILNWSTILVSLLINFVFVCECIVLACLPTSSFRSMTQTSRALVAVSTLEGVDSLILESNKSNASASYSGVRRESFSSSEQSTSHPECPYSIILPC